MTPAGEATSVRAPLRHARDIAVSADMTYVAVLERSRVSVFGLKPEMSLTCTWYASPPLYFVAISADGKSIITSDGIDASVWSRCGEPKAHVRLVALDGLHAVVVGADDEHYAPGQGALPVRFRRGLKRFGGSEPELPALVKKRQAAISL